eukprot:scaffold5043_cov115-Isochrysis_galbana.AAC.5
MNLTVPSPGGTCGIMANCPASFLPSCPLPSTDMPVAFSVTTPKTPASFTGSFCPLLVCATTSTHFCAIPAPPAPAPRAPPARPCASSGGHATSS